MGIVGTSLVTIVFLWATCVHAYLPTFYMDEWCGRTMDLQIQGTESARVLLRPPSRGLQFLQCNVTFKALAGRRVSFHFKGFDIGVRPSGDVASGGCNADFMVLYDVTTQLTSRLPQQIRPLTPQQQMQMRYLTTPISGRLCNRGEIPGGVYTSSGERGQVALMMKNYVHDQMELVVTSFHLAPCRRGEFSCGNSHCIAEHLYCNNYDNCGDGSDLCLLSKAGVAGVAIAVIIVIIIIVIIIAVVLYRRSSRRQSGKVNEKRRGIIRTFIHI